MLHFQEAPDCQACKKSFGFLTRRHHCRACGLSFCDSHAPTRKPMYMLFASVPTVPRHSSQCLLFAGVDSFAFELCAVALMHLHAIVTPVFLASGALLGVASCASCTAVTSSFRMLQWCQECTSSFAFSSTVGKRNYSSCD